MSMASPANSPQTGILWLASYPKSGNTWTRIFLHNLFNILDGKSAEQNINNINEFTTWDISAKAYAAELKRPFSEATRGDVARVRPAVQAKIAERTQGIALVKTHHALVLDRGVPTINTAVTSGAVYIIRNPLDVAVSFAAHMATNVDDAIEQMATENLETQGTDRSVHEVYGSWSQHVSSWTRKPHRTLYILRYEDMLDSPQKTFAGLATHLLLRPTAAQIEEAIERSSFNRLQGQEEGEGFREKPDNAEKFFRAGKKDQWRDKLSRRQIRRVVSRHREMMKKFGYITPELAHL